MATKQKRMTVIKPREGVDVLNDIGTVAQKALKAVQDGNASEWVGKFFLPTISHNIIGSDGGTGANDKTSPQHIPIYRPCSHLRH